MTQMDRQGSYFRRQFHVYLVGELSVQPSEDDDLIMTFQRKGQHCDLPLKESMLQNVETKDLG